MRSVIRGVIPVVASMALAIVVIGIAGGSRAVLAQTSDLVSIIAIEVDRHVLPIEQFVAEARIGCQSGASLSAPHFRTRSGGPAIAIDLNRVPDPDVAGCGFGLSQSGLPSSAAVRVASASRAKVEAWNRATGLSAAILGPAPVPAPVPELTPVALPGVALGETAPAGIGLVPIGPGRVLMVLALALAAGLGAGVIVYRREQQSAPANVAPTGVSHVDVPVDVLAGARHAGMLRSVDVTPVDATVPEIAAPELEPAVTEDSPESR